VDRLSTGGPLGAWPRALSKGLTGHLANSCAPGRLMVEWTTGVYRVDRCICPL
jgi:hypothetical protein